MAGKQSKEMGQAQKAVTSGALTPSDAARKYGVALNSIYRKQWYKDWRAVQDKEQGK